LEAKFSLPGLAFASAVNSSMVRAGTAGCTTSTDGAEAISVIGAKSATGS
jgi:hypothetical protein